MPRTVPDRVKLLSGPYRPPPLTKGDRAACLYRDADVIVTAWSDAPLPWPRGYAPSATPAGGPRHNEASTFRLTRRAVAEIMGAFRSQMQRFRTVWFVCWIAATAETTRIPAFLRRPVHKSLSPKPTRCCI